MSTHAQPSYGKYFVIWIWLIALLAAGTFISYLPISKKTIIFLILLVSLIKVGIVGFFYMHLKSEKTVPIWVVAIFPFFLLGLAVSMIYLGNLFFG